MFFVLFFLYINYLTSMYDMYNTYIASIHIPFILPILLFFCSIINTSVEEIVINIISINAVISNDIGFTDAVRPVMNSILNILDPITFPIAKSVSPFLVAITLVTSSGSDVPIAIIVSAITFSPTPSALARPDAPLTTNCPPPTIPAIPTKSSNISFQFIFSFSLFSSFLLQ